MLAPTSIFPRAVLDSWYFERGRRQGRLRVRLVLYVAGSPTRLALRGSVLVVLTNYILNVPFDVYFMEFPFVPRGCSEGGYGYPHFRVHPYRHMLVLGSGTLGIVVFSCEFSWFGLLVPWSGIVVRAVWRPAVRRDLRRVVFLLNSGIFCQCLAWRCTSSDAGSCRDLGAIPSSSVSATPSSLSSLTWGP